MATLKLSINEELTLDGIDRSNYQTISITGVNYLDHRTMLLPSSSKTSIFNFDEAVAAGTFMEDKLRYARITNHSTTIPVNIEVASSNEVYNFRMNPLQSFYLPSSQMTGSVVDFTYDYISSISLEPSGSDNTARVEFFVATT
ncbi:MAG: hypothetical protein ACO239_07865 [Sediminibacterium sp.]